MRRQLLVNGALLALALGTGAVVWATRSAPTSAELLARQNKLIGTWDRAAVQSLRLQRDGVELELVRDASTGVEGDYRIVKPWQERADIATVRSLLGSLELASFLRSADGVDRARAGLQQATLEIRLKTAKNSEILRLGGPAPAPAGARYLELTSNGKARIVTISAGVAGELDVPLDKFREPRLLDVGRSEIAKLTISHKDGKVELAQHRPGAFFLKRVGGVELAGREATERILTALSRLVTTKFAEPERARADIEQDSASFRLVLEPTGDAKPPITLSVGATCPEAPDQSLVLREERGRGPRAGCMPPDIVVALRASEAELVLDTPFAARVDEVERLVVSGAPVGTLLPVNSPQSFDLARQGGAFKLLSPGGSEVPLDAGNQRIAAIVRARAKRASPGPDSELGPEDGWVRVDLASSGDKPPSNERVRLGKPRGDGSRCMKRDADGVVLCVDAQAAAAFRPDPSLLRGLDILSFAPAELKSLGIETKGLSEQVRRREDGSYELEEPKGYGHDGGLVAELVQTLGTLRAERWVAAAPDASHGLAEPRLSIRVEVSPHGAYKLVVGAATEGGYFASLSGDPGVFVLARSTLATLEMPLIDRSLCPACAAELARIELAHGSRRATLTRNGETWTSAALAAARAQELGETLRALRADFTVHLGPERPAEGLGRPSLVVTFVPSSGKPQLLKIGARDTIAGSAVAYARLDSVDATFALPAATVAALQDF